MEDKGLVWLTDKDGNWINDPNDLSEEEKKKCVMLDFRDIKRLAFNKSRSLQISHKPLMGHSRWKVWLTSLLLLKRGYLNFMKKPKAIFANMVKEQVAVPNASKKS